MTSALRRLPAVLTAEELLDRAFGRASVAADRVDDPHRVFRTKKQCLGMVKSAADSLGAWLDGQVSGWPSLDRLHPFDRAMVAASVGEDGYRQHLGALDWAEERIVVIGRQNADKIQRTGKVEVMHAARREAYGRMSSIVHRIQDDLMWLLEARDTLRALPSIDATQPVVVVTGAPNVGKSALIRSLSSGVPEVASYPFTTKGLHVGHFEARRLSHQVVDTPGLLDRPDAERNANEQQAIAALQHLGSLLLFLIDERGEAGEPPEKQRHLLEEVRTLMPDREVLVVSAKADLHERDEAAWAMTRAAEASEPEDPLDIEALEAACLRLPDGRLAISAVDEVGVIALRRLLVAKVADTEEPTALALPGEWHREPAQLIALPAPPRANKKRRSPSNQRRRGRHRRS